MPRPSVVCKCDRDIFMNGKNQIAKSEDQNPFKDMGFFQFWIVSTVFWMTFPASVAVCYVALGPIRTRQFIKALIHDLLQTLLFVLIIVCIIIYAIYHYVSAWF